MDGHIIMFHTCTGCGGCYGTMFKSGDRTNARPVAMWTTCGLRLMGLDWWRRRPTEAQESRALAVRLTE